MEPQIEKKGGFPVASVVSGREKPKRNEGVDGHVGFETLAHRPRRTEV